MLTIDQLALLRAVAQGEEPDDQGTLPAGSVARRCAPLGGAPYRLTEAGRLLLAMAEERTALFAPVGDVDIATVLEAAQDREQSQAAHVPTHSHAATAVLADAAGPLARALLLERAQVATLKEPVTAPTAIVEQLRSLE